MNGEQATLRGVGGAGVVAKQFLGGWGRCGWGWLAGWCGGGGGEGGGRGASGGVGGGSAWTRACLLALKSFLKLGGGGRGERIGA